MTTDPGSGEPFASALLAHAGVRHTVTVNGQSTVWRCFGAGPALVMLHGGHGDWQHWVRNIDALAPARTIWLPDMPGFGDSDDLPGHAHAPDRMSRLVDTLASALGTLIGPATPLDLTGFSFGGLVAAHLALRVPVQRMALLGPAGHGGRRRQMAALADWRRANDTQQEAALRQNLSSFMLHDPASTDAQAVAIYRSQCMRTRFRSKALSQAGGLAECLDRLTIPVLLAWGEHDVTAEPQRIGPQLTDAHPHRQWQLIADAGHWAPYERHHDVNDMLRDWFEPQAGHGHPRLGKDDGPDQR